MERTYIKDLTKKTGQEVQVTGWISKRRDHGKLIFLDLRDMTGLVQMVSIPRNANVHKRAESLRPEWVISVSGKVNKRPEGMVNSATPLGNIEIEINNLEILNESKTPPFDLIGAGEDIGEENRLKYRYLDLRRPRLQKNMRNRHKVIQFIREYLVKENFIEIETPILSKSTPEGARDFIVPSRLERGKFYALPQSPQQYKQLLMVSGFEKYFQIARCMRDEDTRGDRQAEFTQLDIELSFITQNDILELTEKLFTKLITGLFPDKHVSKKPWPRIDYKDAIKDYKTDSPDLRKKKNDPDELAFAWILNFPLFESRNKDGVYAPSHHMFTAPKEEDIPKLETSPGEVRSYQHDLVLNGIEIGGGSIRIHDPKMQSKIFDLIGFSEKEKNNFNHMLEAFQYGVPPHGGIAPGVDRLLMILFNEPNIREVIAFPKTGEGRDLVMDAPSEVGKGQLEELGIKINPGTKGDK